MKTLLTIILVMTSACIARGEEFMLSDPETGQHYGPFNYSNGAPLLVENRAFILKRTRTPATDLEEKMRKIMIPSIEFRQANITDILMFLTEASIGSIEEPSVNIVPLGLCTDADGHPVTNALPIETTGDEHPEQPRQASAVPLVTLNLRRVSLYDALSIVCEMVGLTFRIDDRGVVFVTSQDREIRSEELKDQPPLSPGSQTQKTRPNREHFSP